MFARDVRGVRYRPQLVAAKAKAGMQERANKRQRTPSSPRHAAPERRGRPTLRRDANTAATREAIIKAARAAFAEHGFAAAALDAIVTAAGVTTGALYHHFRDKRDLFIAVAESVEQEILDELVTTDKADSPIWTRLEHGLCTTLEIAARPDVQRIIFTDAPTVVGVAEWRAVEIRYGFGLMHQTLSGLAANGALIHTSADLAARVLLGALMEAAQAVVLASSKERALRDAKNTLLAFARSLRRETN